jgi:preprotein translocase subunit SecG
MSLYIFITLIAIVAFLLILIIMVQNPKGGGLDASFGGGGGSMLGGVQQTNDFLDKATWYLFGLMVVLILLSNSVIIKTTAEPKSQVKEVFEEHIPQDNSAKPMPNPALDNNTGAETEKK